MKKMVVSLLIMSVLILGVALNTTDAKEKSIYYVCPVHSGMVFEKPGKCPKSGAELVKKEGYLIYRSPMHPEVVSDEPGKCPKCGTKLVPEVIEEIKYVGPMHPEVISDKPGECAKCGAKLVPFEEKKHH